MISRRMLLAGALASVSAASESPAASGGLPERPNVVLILADDLGWGEVGFQGQRMIRTPYLDRLARQGVRFSSAYAGAPLCAPSRAALLTGMHTGHGTVRENPEGGPQRALTATDVTFGQVLQQAGYRTACVGKWGFGPERAGQPSHPNERGFDEFFGFIGHAAAHDYYPDRLWRDGSTVPVDGYAPDLFREEAIRFIGRNTHRPFLLYYPTTLPHSPSVVPGGAGPYRDRPWSVRNQRHAAQVSRLDADVAALVRALRSAGVADRTVLIFAGDNGPHHEKGVTPELFDANGPFRGVKRMLYEGGIRVPMIAWSPRTKPRVVHTPVAFWDLLPTLADLAGSSAPAHLDGRSFAGALSGGRVPEHEVLVWNRPRKMQAIRRGRWKAIRFAPHIAGAGPQGRVELYDLADDPGERYDLADRHPTLVRGLLTRLDRQISAEYTAPVSP